MSLTDEDRSDETVERLTFSGRRHKFGPLVPAKSKYDSDYRVALCNGSIIADERWQADTAHLNDCKRCFPAVQS